ncbi:MAG: dihydropteroate synthase [Paracoccaceae bacterium]
MIYVRPVAMSDPARPPGAWTLAGGWCWFDRAEVLDRRGSRGLVAAADLPADVRDRLTAPRVAFAGLAMDRPRIMGVVNVTPDSFSDGGLYADAASAVAQGRALAEAGAEMLDIGGESTRPGAGEVSAAEETARVLPVIAALASGGATVSVDTRKAGVAAPALDAGARIVNDVSALTFDPALARLVATRGVPVVLMHVQGTPQVMQDDPRYDDVLLDVYDWLEERIAAAEAAGIPRGRIAVDPGIGFGKTVAHNLALIRGLSLYHGLGCPILLGASRKRFIGALAGEPQADRRGPGTLAVTLAAVAQGVQIHRVHDVAGARQALTLWQAATGKG